MLTLTEKKVRILRNILIIGSILAGIKMLFFDYTLDEEYQIVMAYRNILGDHLFVQMWEPHQSSAFMCTILMKAYLWMFGTTTGVVLFLRGCTAIIHLGMSIYFYRVICRITKKEYGFLLALVYFNVYPKLIPIPEFSLMQVWFFTLMILFLMEYYMGYSEGKRKIHFLLLAGMAMSLEVLAYPSCLILFPFFGAVIGIRSKRSRIRDCLLFMATCVAAGAVYLFLILRHIRWEELLRNMDSMIRGDLTHHFMTQEKVMNILSTLGWGVVFLMGIIVFSVLLDAAYTFGSRKKRGEEIRVKITYDILRICVISVIVSCCIQIWYWIVRNSGYEYPQIHLVTIMTAGAVAFGRISAKKKYLLAEGFIGSLLLLVAVVYSSNLPVVCAIPHGIIAPIFGMLMLIYAVQERMPERERMLCYLLLSVWGFTAIFGKGYTMKDGRNYNNILETRGIIKEGPAIGIAADYMSAYMYNQTYEDWKRYVEPGSKVLIVSNLVMSSNTTPYLFQDVQISHYSIIDPTAYDERLMEYWRLYPEKKPDVIIVDCWFGELLEESDSWIMKYIQSDFGYSKYYDGTYVRFYVKDVVHKNI